MPQDRGSKLPPRVEDELLFLREQIAVEQMTLRKGVEALLEDVSALKAPVEYRKDILELAKLVNKLETRMAKIEKSPGIITTAQDHSAVIERGIERAVSRSHTKLDDAHDKLSKLAKELDRRLESHVSAGEQSDLLRTWGIFALVVGFILGMGLTLASQEIFRP